MKPMNAFRRVLFFFICISYVGVVSAKDSTSVRFAYDVDFDMDFDNREFYRSSFTGSMTIFGARITPSLGIDAGSQDGWNHRVMLGIDVMKDFGASPVSPEFSIDGENETSARQVNLDLFKEMTLYYKLGRKFDKTDLDVYAGIFPRRFMSGSYSRAFFSDSLMFYDNNLEGLLVQIGRPKAHFEIGCDWMGKIGESRRERFMIFSSGEGKVLPFMSLGYSAYMYHFACTRHIDGVVDNILASPFVKFDLSGITGLQCFNISLNWLQSLQNDRLHVGRYVFPCGGQLDMEIGHWNAGVRSALFYGKDMMPYYNAYDAGGYKYGNQLYMGSPFYRVHDDGTDGPGIYERLEVFYEPVVGRFLRIRAAAVFHFNGSRYSGCQQVVTFGFNLQDLLHGKRNQ